ncbi:MAG: hypothetical protein Phyf2KO_03030 [Phycisphaerales bacterium]
MDQPADTPQWPKTDTPRTIAVLGWARLALQAAEGTGYNLSASELAAGLAMMGHRVLYMSSGFKYSPVPGMRIRHRESWRGVECYELINSPNLSPSAANFKNPVQETQSATQSSLVASFLADKGVEIVHSHSLEGQGLDLIGKLRLRDIRTVVTLHNYWHVCPQVDLIYREHELCVDYDGGRRCVDCLNESTPRVKKLKRIVNRSAERLLGPKQSELIRLKSKRVLSKARNGNGEEIPPSAVNRNARPDHEVARGHDASGNVEGLIDHTFADPGFKAGKEPVCLDLDANEQFISKGDVHLRVLNDYGKRRAAGIAALNDADLVTPPSEFNAKLHASMGVEESKLRVVRYGQPHFDQINRKARRSPFYDKVPWEASGATRPLRFGFFGTVRPNKGLEVLARAIEHLSPDVRKKSQFIIRAHGGDWNFRKRMAKYPEVNFLGGYDLIQLIASSGEYDVGVLPHIWFDNSPLVMWEHLHAGKPVIAARLGGAADTIKPIDNADCMPGNGLFFPGGCPDKLAERITQMVTGEIPIPSAKSVHEASTFTSYPAHVTEVDAIYQDLMG